MNGLVQCVYPGGLTCPAGTQLPVLCQDNGIGFGVLAGTVAIMIFTFAIMSKMLYERIETIDMGAYLAIEATGATKTRAFFTAVIPQIMGTYLSLSLYSFEINIRYAAILGYVGAGGIGVILNNIL